HLADQLVVPAERHMEHRPDTTLFDSGAGYRIIDLRAIADMDMILAREQSPGRVVGPRHEAFPQEALQRLRVIVHSQGAELLTVVELQAAVIGLTKRVRFLQNSLEHRRGVARREVDGLEDFSCRSLPSLRMVASAICLIPLSGELSKLAP